MDTYCFHGEKVMMFLSGDVTEEFLINTFGCSLYNVFKHVSIVNLEVALCLMMIDHL